MSVTARASYSKYGMHKRDKSAAYERLRQSILSAHPLCQYCFRDTPRRITPATVVDHIRALALGGDNSRENLCSACHDCNSRKAVVERAFIQRGHDPEDYWRDPYLSLWIDRLR